MTSGEAWSFLEGQRKELVAVQAELAQARRDAKKKSSDGGGPELVWQDKQGAVFVEQPLPFLHTRRWQSALHVLRIRQRVLGLFAVEFDDAHQRPHPGQRGVQRLGANAKRHSFGAEFLQPGGEVALLRYTELTLDDEPPTHTHQRPEKARQTL